MTMTNNHSVYFFLLKVSKWFLFIQLYVYICKRNRERYALKHIIMKKTICLFLLLVVITASKMYAQSFGDRLHFELSGATGMKDDGTTPVDFSFKFHVDVLPVSYVFITAENNVSLHKEDGVKTYFHGESVGGGLGVKLLNRAKSIHSLDVRLKVLGCLGSPDWKRMAYDASVAWYIKSRKFSPVVELGYRYLDSRTEGVSNYGNAYLSIGLRY